NLGTGIELGTDDRLLPGGHIHRGADETDQVVALAVLAGLIDVLAIGGGHPGADEVVLQPGGPATGHGLAQVALVHVLELELLIGTIGAPVGGAEEGGHAGGGGARRIATAITLDLTVETADPGLDALVVDQVVDLDQILAPGEGTTLGVVAAVVAAVFFD